MCLQGTVNGETHCHFIVRWQESTKMAERLPASKSCPKSSGVGVSPYFLGKAIKMMLLLPDFNMGKQNPRNVWTSLPAHRNGPRASCEHLLGLSDIS